MSRGRAAWNIVTTDWQAAAENRPVANPDPSARYERAEEYVEAVLRLWDSWEDDAIRLDREAGPYADPAIIHHPTCPGTVRVAGALTSPGLRRATRCSCRPAPQRRPGFAARFAEAIFTAQPHLDDARRSSRT